MGMVDCSGSAVVHITGGVTALYATYILGPRSGRFVDKEGQELSKPGLTKGHSMSLQMLGTMILWFCWYGFNSGSALLLPAASAEASSGQIAARAAINTTLSAGAGTIMALIVNGYLKQRQTGEFVLCISMCMNGWYV
jgi:ammonium transporter, Amt family